MTIRKENKQAASRGNLLTSQEQAICKQITSREAPHSQRALALLAINEKCTQAQAAVQAGLSAGQVKYWVAKFRGLRLDIFPESLLDELGAEEKVELVTNFDKESESVTEKEDSAKVKSKEAEAKKGKRAKKETKKDKKSKKDKRSKKDKKSKKAKKGKKETKKVTKDKKSKKTKKTKGKTKKKNKEKTGKTKKG